MAFGLRNSFQKSLLQNLRHPFKSLLKMHLCKDAFFLSFFSTAEPQARVQPQTHTQMYRDGQAGRQAAEGFIELKLER